MQWLRADLKLLPMIAKEVDNVRELYSSKNGLKKL